MDIPTVFNSIDEECNYWKDQCKIYYKKYTDLQQELEDFTENSHQLEAELEMSLEQREKTIKDLQFTQNQLQCECESIRKKSQLLEIENHNYDKKYQLINGQYEQQKLYVRELEQKNDDLERAHRIVSESVAGFEGMLNQAYEKNALLEMEVDEKEALQVKLQRLMDETRDLKQELNIKCLTTTTTTTIPSSQSQQQQQHNDNGNEEDSNVEMIDNSDNIKHINTITNTNTNNNTNPINCTTTINNNNNNNKHTEESEEGLVGSVDDGGKKFNDHILMNGNNTMAASSRISALMIVGELLRKVNSMEARLKACHAAMPPPHQNLHQQSQLKQTQHNNNYNNHINNQQHHHHHHHHQNNNNNINRHSSLQLNDSNRSSFTGLPATATANASTHQ